MGATATTPLINRSIAGTAAAVRARVVLITTAAQTLGTFFPNQIRDFVRAGFAVSAITSGGDHMDRCRQMLDVPIHMVAMRRSISPFADVIAVVRLVRLLRALAPAIVQTHTPKAGLLGMLAAWVAGVPVRICTVNGLVWETGPAWRRWLLRWVDRIAFTCATEVFCVSESLRRQLDTKKARVLGRGGSHGVDVERFRPDPVARAATRELLGIPNDAKVIGFAGRIVGDKGIRELAEAWERLPRENLYLLLAGVEEPANPIPDHVRLALASDGHVIRTGKFVADMPSIYAAMDVLVLPTYREGLPNVVLEAAAMELPVVATSVTGCVDVVEHGVTGLLVPPRDAAGLRAAILQTLGNEPEARRMAAAARRMVERDFAETTVSARLTEEYCRLLQAVKARGEGRAG